MTTANHDVKSLDSIQYHIGAHNVYYVKFGICDYSGLSLGLPELPFQRTGRSPLFTEHLRFTAVAHAQSGFARHSVVNSFVV